MSRTGCWSSCPPTTRSRTSSAILERLLASVPEAHALVVDDGSPDGTGELAEKLAAATPGCTCCTGRQGRASARPTSPASAGPASAATTSSSRWTPTARTPPSSCRGCWTALEDADLVLGSALRARRRGRPTGRLHRLLLSRAGQPLHPLGAAAAARRRDRRFPGRAGGADRPAALRRGGQPGLLLPGRLGLAGRPRGRPRGRGADHLHRTHVRQEQDERLDRWRSIGTGHRVGPPGPAGRPPAGPGPPSRTGTTRDGGRSRRPGRRAAAARRRGTERRGRVVGRRLRLVAGLLVLVELVVFVLVAGWIGVGWTILATLATSALGWLLLARQGMRALADLRERARTRRPAGRELGDAGLVAVGGLLMVLPGFVGDVIGLLCLLPGTRGLVRACWPAWWSAGCPAVLRPRCAWSSVRTAEVPPTAGRPGRPRRWSSRASRARPRRPPAGLTLPQHPEGQARPGTRPPRPRASPAGPHPAPGRRTAPPPRRTASRRRAARPPAGGQQLPVQVRPPTTVTALSPRLRPPAPPPPPRLGHNARQPVVPPRSRSGPGGEHTSHLELLAFA